MVADNLGELLADMTTPRGGTRLLTGAVTDVSVWPPLIDTGGGAVATPVVGGYTPFVGDIVAVLTDWNGKFSATRICLGRLAVAGGVRLSRVANQSATGGAGNIVSWDTETYDQGGWWTSGTNITVPTGATGIYAIHFEMDGAANWGDGTLARISIGGTIFATFGIGRTANPITASMTAALGAGSVITADVFNNGATQNMTGRIWISPIS